MKLVRDKIPEIIRKSGRSCTFYIEEDIEKISLLLKDKMYEELDEFLEDPSTEEASDMYEVLCALAWLNKISMSDVLTNSIGKREKRGGFFNGIVLKEVTDGKG
tara:strand:- start:3312 stop:3623 length:312 start_codon:yes stop_codon:yes gene_type:complete